MKKHTLTIGIPAFNEEENIKKLVSELLKQNFENVRLEKILIISDGSTDNTVQILKEMKEKLITVINNKDRRGAMNTQNEILKKTNSDILVMLDADVLPTDNNFIEEIVKPLLSSNNVGIVGADTKSIQGKTFFEKVIADSHEFKKSIYRSVKNGNNLYLCHGRARAFSKKFYKKLHWVEEGPEDAYSYLECKKLGFDFVFAPRAAILFKSPSKFSDHSKQSIRFERGKTNIEKYFDVDFLKKEYAIPKSLVLKKLIKFSLLNPISTVSFVWIKLYIQYVVGRKKVNLSTWEIATSSKKLN